MHGADVVVHGSPLADHQLDVVRLEHGEARPDRGEVRRLAGEREGEETVAQRQPGHPSVEAQDPGHVPKVTSG
jgi:hypothetical protein